MSDHNTSSDPRHALGMQLPAIAELAHLINRLAHGLRAQSDAARRAFGLKADLVSLLVELGISDVHVSWHGDHLLLVSIGRLRVVHIPFSKLSYAAQCRVIQDIGPGPDAAEAA